MKIYINNKKTNKGYIAAMTVYSEKGYVLYCETHTIRGEDFNKFDMTLLAIEWAVRKFRIMAQNGEFSEEEKIKMYISSETIYNWICNEVSPKKYIDIFTRVQMELSLMLNEVEIFKTKKNKALYRSKKEKRESILDILGDFE